MINKEQRKEIWDTAMRIVLWRGLSETDDDPEQAYEFSQWEKREKERLSNFLDRLTRKI